MLLVRELLRIIIGKKCDLMTEKAQTLDCKCPTPDHSGRGTCQRCDGFACEYADRGQTRCPSWRCDCFIETHPFDNPQGLHPEAFIVGGVIPPDKT